jgi:hypothetical protein
VGDGEVTHQAGPGGCTCRRVPKLIEKSRCQNRFGRLILQLRGPPSQRGSAVSVRAILVCAALLSALVGSCGRSPVYVVAPAPEGAPAQSPAATPEGGVDQLLQGGLAEVPQPAPAAPAHPPAARPQPPLVPVTRAPAPFSVRPGGANRLVDNSEKGTLSSWWDDMKDNCRRAGYESTCVHYALRTETGPVDQEAYAKASLKKYRPIATRNEDKKAFSGLL